MLAVDGRPLKPCSKQLVQFLRFLVIWHFFANHLTIKQSIQFAGKEREIYMEAFELIVPSESVALSPGEKCRHS